MLGRAHSLLRWGWTGRSDQNQENWFDNRCNDPGKREVTGGGEPRQGKEGFLMRGRRFALGVERRTELNAQERRCQLGH